MMSIRRHTRVFSWVKSTKEVGEIVSKKQRQVQEKHSGLAASLIKCMIKLPHRVKYKRYLFGRTEQ